MADPSASPSLMEAVPMFRLDSGDTVESAFGSALNTPADEKNIQFDSLDGKLLAMGMQHDLGDPIVKSPRRIALSRGFSKAMIDAKKSVTSVASPSSVPERVYAPAAPSAPLSHTPPSSNLTSSKTSGMPSLPLELPPRPQTPEPSILDEYAPSAPQTLIRTTPRQCPPMWRDSFSPQSTPVIVVQDEHEEGDSTATQSVPAAVEFTPHTHSTLRHRKVMYPLQNHSTESISSVKRFSQTVAAPFQTPDATSLSDDGSEYEYDEPVLPPLSPLLPLQLVLFPVYCVAVGGAILMKPEWVETVAFPGSLSTSSSVPTSSASAATNTTTSAFSFPWHSYGASAARNIATILPLRAPANSVRLFEHWATVAHMHVFIFLAFLVACAYVDLRLGSLLAVVCAVQAGKAWGDFIVGQFEKARRHAGTGVVCVDGKEGEEERETEERVTEEMWALGGGGMREMLWQVLICEGGIGEGGEVRFVGKRSEAKYMLVKRMRRERKGQMREKGGAGLDGDDGSTDPESDVEGESELEGESEVEGEIEAM